MKRLLLTLLLASLASVLLAQEAPPPPARGSQPTPDRMRPGGPGIGGTITALSSNQMTLRTFDGRTVTIKLNADTRYRKDREPAKLADFKVGDAVMVRGEPTGEDTWTAQAVMTRTNAMGDFREGLGKRFIAGEIKSIEGTRITILRVDGETQTIEVDENTSFRKQGESVTLGELKAGDRVSGRGEVRNGVFFPAVLNVGEFRRMQPPPPADTREPH